MEEQVFIRIRFGILLGIILIAGFIQGMLMPIVAILFQQAGVPSSVNGLHSTGIYIGILIATPFMEGLLRKFGYKSILLVGGLLIIIPLFLFPIWKSLPFWFLLRFVIGIGMSMLQIGTQTWVTSFSSIRKRGRNISLWGLCFGLGFGLGPLMTRFLEINESLPFILSACISLLFCLPLFWLRNEYPESESENSTMFDTFKHFGHAWKYAWVALLFPFTYGFLEASLNGIFPVYALKIGIDVKDVSVILPAFALGSIVFQLPLGIISDRLGRRKVLIISMIFGVVFFTLAGIIQHSMIGLFLCFFIAGMFVGSVYSLGVSYMTDLVSKDLLPAGNILCSLLYSIGSIGGPFAEGLAMQYVEGMNLFYSISFILIIVFVALLYFKKETRQAN
jgi:MFS family permease